MDGRDGTAPERAGKGAEGPPAAEARTGAARPAWAALLAVLLVWAAAVAWYGKTQRHVSQNGGKGWDGAKYHAMHMQALHGERLAGEKPYIYRVATPWLAARLGGALGLDVRTAFHAVNLVSVLLTAWLLLWIMAVLGVKPPVAVFLVATFLLQWHAPLRQQYYDSFNVDAASQPFTCLILLLSLAMRRGASRVLLLSAVTFVGVFFRESVLFATFAAWAAVAWEHARAEGLRPRRLPRRLLDRALLLEAAPLLAGALGIALTHALVEGQGPYSFILTVFYYLYHKPLMVVIHAFFNAYGTVLIPVLVFAPLAWREIRRTPLLGIYALITLGLGWTAGGDTTRINYWGCMTLLPVMGLVLSRLRLRTFGIGVFLLLEVVTTRMLFPMPDYPGAEAWTIPLLTNWGTDFPYFDLWSELANPRVLMISLAQYVLLTAAAFLWIGWRGREKYLLGSAEEALVARAREAASPR